MWKLGSFKDFRYTNQSSLTELPGVDDGEDYTRVRVDNSIIQTIMRQQDNLTLFPQSAMTILGLSEREQMDIFTVVAAILHLGNARFEEKVCKLQSIER